MIISDLLMDTVAHLSDIIYWLNRRGSLNDYFLIAEHYMNAENFSGASYILNNSIPLQFELTDELNELLDDYIWYNDFRQTVKNDNRTLAQLEQSELDQLLNFAEEKDNKISEYCRNILCFFYENCYPAESPLEIEPRKLRPQSGHHSNLPKSVFVKVYPNPATTYTTFEWKIPGNSKSVLRISNSTGQIVATAEFTVEEGQWLWDTREIKAGVYVYELLNNNQRLESGRITVVK
jgi:hypothetical protein